ncbi:hypothetical protein FB451DRAFT_434486 [Mycena latifolia]|nr:hypothetical protein FB451DRAFT_434486 [Mycena latifolia]
MSGALAELEVPETPSIHTIPYELLAKILIFALTPRADPKYGGTKVASVDDVLVLCQVCGRWRKVARNTPQLWVADKFPKIVPKDWKVSFGTTEMFLERSAPLPISINLYPTATKYRTYGPDLPAILDTLSSAAHRWKSFTMYTADAETDTVALARIPADKLDSLKRLVLTLHNSSNRETWDCPELTVFLPAPRLRDVRIDVRNATSNFLLLPWAQLTRLFLTYDSPQSCLDILVCCSNVVSVDLHTRQWKEEDDIGITRPVCLAHLEVLAIDMIIWEMGEHLAPFLERFKLPALKSLSLSLGLALPIDYDWWISWLTPALIPFLMQSPNLERLYTNDCLYPEDIRDILQHTPSLTKLVFTETSINDDFFAALRYSETEQLAPKLETVELLNVGSEFEESSIAEMIESRWWPDDEPLAPAGVARLKRVQLQNEYDPPWNFSEEFKEKMRAYRSQGLEFTAFYF